MKIKLTAPPLVLVLSLALVLALAAPAAAGAKPDFKAFGSCANSKPFKASHSCHYDRGRFFRATFVFKSNVGKRAVKACFRLYGAKPLGGGHACAKLGPLARKVYPFKISGVRQAFSVKVRWYAKQPGQGFEQVASSFMRVKP